MLILGKWQCTNLAKDMFGYCFKADKRYKMYHLNKFYMGECTENIFAAFDIK